MTPKEKAKELILKFKELPQDGTMMFYLAFEISKQCALIAVDEILQVDCCDMSESRFNNHIDYWVAVVQEIEKL
jgi:hypothetical protein